jgi:uncharacterized protein YggE
MKTKYQSVLIAVLLVAVITLVGGLTMPLWGSSEAEASTTAQTTPPSAALPRTITVVGEGRITAQPDVARINVGVETINPDVQKASSEASATMENLLKTLSEQGVATKDVQTSYFNVWVERPYGPDGLPGSEVYYHVNNSLSVTVRNLDNVSTVLGLIIDAGANNINGVEFNVSNRNELQSEARSAAVDNARAKALELADLQGVTVGEVVTISEVVETGGFVEQAAYAQGVGGGGVGPISPGEVEVSVRLQVSYEIE